MGCFDHEVRWVFDGALVRGDFRRALQMLAAKKYMRGGVVRAAAGGTGASG